MSFGPSTLIPQDHLVFFLLTFQFAFWTIYIFHFKFLDRHVKPPMESIVWTVHFGLDSFPL